MILVNDNRLGYEHKHDKNSCIYVLKIDLDIPLAFCSSYAFLPKS